MKNVAPDDCLDCDLVVDVHVHVGAGATAANEGERFSFEPRSDDPAAPARARYDSYMAPRLMGRPEYWVLRRMLGITPGADPRQRDEQFVQATLRHVTTASGVDRVVALAFDEVHDDDGKPLGPAASRRAFGSDLYTSNTYVHDLCARHPDRFLFGASVHPYRTLDDMTAVDMLDEVAAAGAVLIKWLPQTQCIRADDPRTVAFLRRAGELHMPMLIHYGDERALPINRRELADLKPLLGVLRNLHDQGMMPPTIIAHCATPNAYRLRPFNSFPAFETAVLGEFADTPLYGDTAGLGIFTRAGWLKRLVARQDLTSRLVHGSDFPVPVTPVSFIWHLGRRYLRIARTASWIDRDYELKLAIGMDPAVMTRGWRVLREGLVRRFAPGVRSS
jgi:predicted TIM-barrel fold metal-dependent hydrolase